MTDHEWHIKPITHRKALLREAGYAPNNYAFRVWHFLPEQIRIDVEYVINRQFSQADHKPVMLANS